MASSRDVRDIMGFSAGSAALPAPAPKKKAPKPAFGKKATGINREILALHGDRPPPVAIVDSTKAYRKTFKRDFKPSHWEHVEFDNTARSDGLRLSHWRKQPLQEKSASDQNGDTMDIDHHADTKPDNLPYAFAKYNVEVTVPTYTDEQYEKLLVSDSWSREETDYLMGLVKDYYQKWPVIIDRYEWDDNAAQPSEAKGEDANEAVSRHTDPKRRDMESLKERYYFISAKMMEQSFTRGIADMNVEEFALHEQYTKFRPDVERQRKHLAWELTKRKTEEVKEEEYLLSELQRIMISASKFETERAELRQRLEHAVSPSKDRQVEMSSANLHQLWQQLIQQDRSRKPRSRISVDGNLQSPAAGVQTPASAGGHRDSVAAGSNQKKGSISQNVPIRNLSVRDEARFGVTSPPERIVSGVAFRTDKLLKLRQAKSQIQTQKIGQALVHLDVPDLLALPTTKVVQAFESLIQKINLLLDSRKVLAKEDAELATALAVKAEVERQKRAAEGLPEEEPAVAADATATTTTTTKDDDTKDVEGEEDADGEADADGEDVEMTDAPAATAAEEQNEDDGGRPSSSRSNHTRNKRSVSVLSATSSRGSRRRK